MNKKVLGILCALAIVSSCVIYGAGEKDDQNQKQLTKEEQEQLDKAKETYTANADDDGNVQADMVIQAEEKEDTPYYAKKQKEDFRGDQPVDGEDATIHYIEDNPYNMSENSLTYRKSGEKVASGSELTGSPNINWTITEEGGSGEDKSDNNNSATKDCTFSDAGTYSVHNSGSRQLSEADGIGGTDEEMKQEGEPGDLKKEGTGDNDKKKKDEKKYMTAEGRIPVKVHDVTPPDVWIAFQENDIDSKFADTLEDKIRSNEGIPLDKNDDLFAKSSFIFIDEGKLYPKPENYDKMSDEEKAEVTKKIQEETAVYGRRDQEYPYKSVRVTLSGSIFNEAGSSIDTSNAPAIVHTIESNRDTLNREADVDFTKKVYRHEDNKKLSEVANEDLLDKNGNGKYAIFARRNVPLLPVVMVCDNGNKRATAAPASADPEAQVKERNADGDAPEENKNALKTSKFRIYSSNKADAIDGETVKQESDGSYLFRIANYPKKNFEDQPYYFFEAEVQDCAMNTTKVRIPLNIVNTTANFEGNSK